MTEPVTCPECWRDIRTATGCNQTLSYRYGDEPGARAGLVRECRDCGTPLGDYHHAFCCVSICLMCDNQRLFCAHSPAPGLEL